MSKKVFSSIIEVEPFTVARMSNEVEIIKLNIMKKFKRIEDIQSSIIEDYESIKKTLGELGFIILS